MLTDTDSSVYEIKTEDVYEDFCENKDLFDFSDYSLNSLKLLLIEVITHFLILLMKKLLVKSKMSLKEK